REPKNTKKNIANYECSIFQRIVKNDQETACVSERFERELRPVLKMLKYGRSSEVLFHVPKLGLVLEYQSIVSNDINTGQQESRYSFALSEVQKETFEKSLFQIPKGYKVKTETPNDSVILGAPWDPPEIQVPHKLGN
ncbi:MAG TPA: hypothetical protein VI895_14630, partial [Bdellovibrionota bacterium]|nr:hypothetical protein [Bdellovibrionota bacterium]